MRKIIVKKQYPLLKKEEKDKPYELSHTSSQIHIN